MRTLRPRQKHIPVGCHLWQWFLPRDDIAPSGRIEITDHVNNMTPMRGINFAHYDRPGITFDLDALRRFHSRTGSELVGDRMLWVGFTSEYNVPYTVYLERFLRQDNVETAEPNAVTPIRIPARQPEFLGLENQEGELTACIALPMATYFRWTLRVGGPTANQPRPDPGN